MGNCFKITSSASIHPEINSLGSTSSQIIKVRMKAGDLEKLFRQAVDVDGGVGKLILDGCIEGRWEFRNVHDDPFEHVTDTDR